MVISWDISNYKLNTVLKSIDSNAENIFKYTERLDKNIKRKSIQKPTNNYPELDSYWQYYNWNTKN